MASSSISSSIGKTTFVRGRVTGDGDLEIAGRVEGDVTISGSLTVDTSGIVAANISASRIVIHGAVKGDLTAEEAIVIDATARIVGDLRAPRISIAQGALVRGHVQTGGGGAAARPRAATAARATTTHTKEHAAPVRAKAVAAAPVKKAAAVARHQPATTTTTNHKTPRAAIAGALSGAGRVPPAPVVPVLKKGTKAVQKKR